MSPRLAVLVAVPVVLLSIGSLAAQERGGRRFELGAGVGYGRVESTGTKQTLADIQYHARAGWRMSSIFTIALEVGLYAPVPMTGPRLRGPMQFEIAGARPRLDATAIVAPTAVLSGDVTLGANVIVSFGALILGDDGPVVIGPGTVVRENVVLRAGRHHPLRIGANVLIGAQSALYGCTVEDEVFLATGVTLFHGACIGARAEVRIRGVVHVNSVLAPGAVVPIGWVAVGNPAVAYPASAHEQIWAVQRTLDFPGTVYGIERSPDGTIDMRLVTERAVTAARRGGWTRVDE